MKKYSGFIPAAICIMAFCISTVSCKKKDNVTVTQPVKTDTVKYASLNAFLEKARTPSQFFTIDATAGGSFTTAQGTKVTIRPNALVDLNNNPVTGSVKVEFKDIYKKSDMLLNNIPVMMKNGWPLVSSGEFFIKMTQNDTTTVLHALNIPIKVELPAGAKAIDKGMMPFMLADTGAGGGGWRPSGDSTKQFSDSVSFNPNSYVFSLYSFSYPYTKGTWCNSDNETYFLNYTQTKLTLVPDDQFPANTVNVYLMFKGLNSMVHVYEDSASYPYQYAPEGLACTMVAVGTKDSKLYACYKDITISANQTVHFTMSETTQTDFVNKIKELDN